MKLKEKEYQKLSHVEDVIEWMKNELDEIFDEDRSSDVSHIAYRMGQMRAALSDIYLYMSDIVFKLNKRR